MVMCHARLKLPAVAIEIREAQLPWPQPSQYYEPITSTLVNFALQQRVTALGSAVIMSDSQVDSRSINSDVPASTSILDTWTKRCDVPKYLEKSCSVCSNADEPHAGLCSDCQPWRDLLHIFYCPDSPKPWHYVSMGSVSSLLKKTDCMLCDAICSSVR